MNKMLKSLSMPEMKGDGETIKRNDMLKSTLSMKETEREAQTKRKYPLTAADYKLLEEIGHGVSAKVYRAFCIPLKEMVAIKDLDLERCNNNLDDIQREAKTMQLILHPNVVTAHCSFMVDHNLWVVMPFLAGGSCLNLMKTAYPNGLEEQVIATVLKDTLKALEYLHKQGLIHRDVKAGNILMDEQGGIKLADFGVSACMFDTGDRQRVRNTFVGTPCWMAPEIVEQRHGYDFKADIWSFGITALELAHGHAPFSKYTPMEVLLMTIQNAPPRLADERGKRFSKFFKEMIAMCLVKDPSNRPSAEKLLKHSFFKNVRSNGYVAKHLLHGLPTLGERVNNLKLKDEARLFLNQMPYTEQEEKSQTEYKLGINSWNFTVEDLKAEASLLDEGGNSSTSSTANKHIHEHPKGHAVDASNDPARPRTHHLDVHPLQEEEKDWNSRQGSVVASLVQGAGISNQTWEDGKRNHDRTRHQLESGGNRHLKEKMDYEGEDRGIQGESKDSEDEKDRVVADVIQSKVYMDTIASSGALGEKDEEGPSDHINLSLFRSSSYNDVTQHRSKGPLLQKKSRFLVISEDLELPKAVPQLPASTVLSQRANLWQQTVHKDHISHDVTSSVSSGQDSNVQRSGVVKNLSRSLNAVNTTFELGGEQYRDQHIIELQNTIANLRDELQAVKLRNISLEKQLSKVQNEEDRRSKQGSSEGNL